MSKILGKHSFKPQKLIQQDNFKLFIVLWIISWYWIT